MGKKKQPHLTESDLEARIQGTIQRVFPCLPGDGIKHQTKFSLKIGRQNVAIDGLTVSQAEGRSDILLFFKDQPLAVLELKRPGLPLTRDDAEQGLSYSSFLRPHPPLVVVTNGEDVQFFESHTGASWSPREPSEQELHRLVVAAGQVAAVDLKRAIEVLLGPTSRVWVEAVRKTTSEVLEEVTGNWDQPLLPFVREFLIPRTATENVLGAIRRSRIVIVEGSPLIGKSSILRELALRDNCC